MKKVIVSAFFTLFSIGLFAQGNNNDLPETARDFINENFSAASVLEVKEYSNWQIWEDEKYEVRLSNGIELDYDESWDLIEIDSKNNEGIPLTALPAEISSYLEANYPNAQVLGWENQDKDQELELSDGTELEFDAQGNFRKID